MRWGRVLASNSNCSTDKLIAVDAGRCGLLIYSVGILAASWVAMPRRYRLLRAMCMSKLHFGGLRLLRAVHAATVLRNRCGHRFGAWVDPGDQQHIERITQLIAEICGIPNTAVVPSTITALTYRRPSP